MRIRGGIVAAIAIAAVMGGIARAREVSDDIVDATVGEWLIVSEDGSLGCHITLGKEKPSAAEL